MNLFTQFIVILLGASNFLSVSALLMWQDLIFTVGSAFSILVLMPTLKNRMATIPLGTSVPSALIGIIYGSTFFTMGLTYSAAGSVATGVLWSLIAMLRSPDSPPRPSADQTTSEATTRQRNYTHAGD